MPSLAPVQAKSSTTASGNASLSFNTPTTPGNTVMVMVAEFFSWTTFSFTPTVSDSINGTYTPALLHDNGGGGYSPSQGCWIFPNAASMSTVDIVGGPGQFDWSIYELPGLAASPVDVVGGYHTDPATTAYAALGITTTQAGIVFGLHVIHQTGTMNATPSGGFTKAGQNITNDPSHVVQYLETSGAGTYTSTGAWDVSADNDSIAVSFKAAGGGAAAFVPYQPQYQWAPIMAQ